MIGVRIMETTLLNDLATSNPGEPATKGLVLLLRAEMKSEFKAVDLKFEQIDKRFEKIDGSLELLAQQVSVLSQQMSVLINRA